MYDHMFFVSDKSDEYVEGDTRKSGDAAQNRHLIVFLENQGDGVIQQWSPSATSSGELRVLEADSTSGRFRASFEATLVAQLPRNERSQRLPDTLRLTEGMFEITLKPRRR